MILKTHSLDLKPKQVDSDPLEIFNEETAKLPPIPLTLEEKPRLMPRLKFHKLSNPMKRPLSKFKKLFKIEE